MMGGDCERSAYRLEVGESRHKPIGKREAAFRQTALQAAKAQANSKSVCFAM